MFSKRIHLAAIIAIASILSATATVCAAAPASYLQKQAREPGRTSGDLSRIPYLLRTKFLVPLSYEGHPSYSRKIEAPFEVEYHVSRNETLASCLDRLVAASRGLLIWTTIRGNIVIMPKKQREDEILNAMDTEVSLEVKSASAWEAFKALEKAVNSAAGAARKLQIVPAPLVNVRKPHAQFSESRTISLKLDNVTAREAACAIMAASPIPLSYTYLDAPDDADTDGLRVLVADAGRMTGEEALAWDIWDPNKERNK